MKSVNAILLSLLFLMACQSNGQQLKTSEKEGPTRRELYDNLRQSKKILVVYGNSISGTEPDVEDLLKSWAGNWRSGEIGIRKDSELDPEEIRSNPLFLVGTPAANTVLNNLVDRLPVRFHQNGFTFGERRFDQPGDLLRISFYPNPLNPSMPLFIMTGNSDQAITEWISSVPNGQFWSDWGYEVFDEKYRTMLGNFADTTWRMDKRIHYDLGQPDDPVLQTAHFTFFDHGTHLTTAQVKEIAHRSESTIESIRRFTATTASLPKVRYHLYPSAEVKGLKLQNTAQAHCNFEDQTVHTVVCPSLKDNSIQAENAMFIRAALGGPAMALLERGLSIHFTEKWHKKGYRYWASLLAQSDNAPPLRDLFDEELMEKESPLVGGCMAAAFVDFLLEYWGKAEFLQKYAAWKPLDREAKVLEEHWQKYLRSLPAVDRRNKITGGLPYLKGFNFAHEGYRIFNGYGSQMAARSLKQLRNLGANSIAIVPYSYMREPNRPSFLPLMQRAGSENDESVIHTAFVAQQAGMYTVLKPQIWFGRAWPGDLEMKDPTDWEIFFDYYYRWMRHYALLAEMYQMDMLCVGVEFAKATLQREEDWRKLIRKLRGIYAGPLIYAANWGDEFEQLGFWDELDYIGVNCYYPLSKKSQASSRDLDRGFRAALVKIEKVQHKYQRPVIFTEIGFRSVDQPWINPHEDSNGRKYNEDHQRRCYEAVFKNLRGKEWCSGILWWKWPSYLGYRGENNTGFTPHNKETEKIIAKWWKE